MIPLRAKRGTARLVEPVGGGAGQQAARGAGGGEIDPLRARGLRFYARLLRRVGALVGARVFWARRAACGACEIRRAGEHPGVWGCGACGACGGHPERMLAAATTCPRGRWGCS